MKRRLLLIVPILTILMFTLLLPACSALDTDDSVKSLTKPYLAQYECTEARFGNMNILDYFDYIRITMINKDELEICYKPKDGERKCERGSYSIDPQTRELEAELGILGNKFKEKVVVKNGQFVISKVIDSNELYLKFQVK